MNKLMCVYACTCMHIQAHVSLSMHMYVCMCIYVCVCMHEHVSVCLFHKLCVASNVQKGSVYKYFTSASSFFHSIYDIMNLGNYNALLSLLDLLLIYQS